MYLWIIVIVIILALLFFFLRRGVDNRKPIMNDSETDSNSNSASDSEKSNENMSIHDEIQYYGGRACDKCRQESEIMKSYEDIRDVLKRCNHN
jgi:hypothetical protein